MSLAGTVYHAAVPIRVAVMSALTGQIRRFPAHAPSGQKSAAPTTPGLIGVRPCRIGNDCRGRGQDPAAIYFDFVRMRAYRRCAELGLLRSSGCLKRLGQFFSCLFGRFTNQIPA